MKKCLIIAYLFSILLISCSTIDIGLAKKYYNENRDCSLQLLLESSVDTVFYETRYEKVLQVTLINTARKPYYITEPYVVQYDRFRYIDFISVEFTRKGCQECWVSEGTTIHHIISMKHIYIRKNKPYIYSFAPNFDELICHCDHEESKSGTYQIRTFYKIGNDTIFSNPVSLYYKDSNE